jgi:hypothetical protein
MKQHACVMKLLTQLHAKLQGQMPPEAYLQPRPKPRRKPHRPALLPLPRGSARRRGSAE